MIRDVLVNLVSNRSVHLASKSAVYHPICTLRACNSFKGSVGGVKGSGVEERVMNTLLNLKKGVRLLKTLLISLQNKAVMETQI